MTEKWLNENTVIQIYNILIIKSILKNNSIKWLIIIKLGYFKNIKVYLYNEILLNIMNILTKIIKIYT